VKEMDLIVDVEAMARGLVTQDTAWKF